ncbi:MAG: hypothetical protein QM598_05915 [Protaetiibacter sp.]
MTSPIVAYRIQQAAADHVSELADRAQVSKAEMLEFLIWHTEIAPDGLPVGWRDRKAHEEQ